MPSQTCYARAKRDLAIGRSRFVALVADAISSRLVAGPWRVHRQRLGRSEVADPLTISTVDGSASLCGDDPGDLLAMLPDLARTSHDLSIIFAGFNRASRKVAAELQRYHYGDCPVAFVSLKVATTVDVDEIIGDEEQHEYGDPLAEDESAEDDADEDDEEDVEGDDYPDELSLQDAAIFPGHGPDFADLDGKSLLMRFLARHFGSPLVGESHGRQG